MTRYNIQIADYALSLFRQICQKNFIIIIIIIGIIIIIIIIVISIFIIRLVTIINVGPCIYRRGLERWA